MSKRQAYIAGIVWASIFGFSFLVTKGALDAFSPFQLLFLRFAAASAALGLLAALRLIRLDFRRKSPRPLVLICLMQPIAYFACETYGVKGSATSTAGLILGALPAAVAALSVPMLKERLARRQVAGLATSVAGVALVVLASSSGGGGAEANSPVGLVLLIGALASAAFYNVFSRRAREAFSPVEITFAMMLSGCACFGAAAAAESLLGSPRAGLIEAVSAAPPGAWAAIAYLGLLCSVLAFFLVNLSLAKLKASQASVFGTVTTLVSLGAGVAFRGESPGLVGLVGAAAIVCGVWATNTGEGKASNV